MHKGFSLVELLVVVAIIGVLAGVGVVGYDRYVENTREKVLLENWNNVKRAIEFEMTVADNNLTSVMKEFDGNGNMVKRDSSGIPTTTTNASEQTKITSFTSCHNFTHSVKKHFEHFKNPWNKEWVSITVDDKQAWEHRKGQIHVFCWNSPKADGSGTNYGSGAGCAIGKARIGLKAYIVNKGRHSVSPPDNTYRRVHWIGSKYFGTKAEAKAHCGWDDTSATTDPVYGSWIVDNVAVNTDAGGTCGSSQGTNICD